MTELCKILNFILFVIMSRDGARTYGYNEATVNLTHNAERTESKHLSFTKNYKKKSSVETPVSRF